MPGYVDKHGGHAIVRIGNYIKNTWVNIGAGIG
jgi:hypothetical protein